ncbi:MAG: hypothetical protein A3B38_02290 [Candidatus Levybacteria bacterium RIFCSPLOWO2_01_FULL_36_13]|nr:MAG: hypothetical protein A2684_00945 [Candidatus Levybacteria bacterium RIFCSPHIGHO2_01_FULL_36_15b]OGH34925.1 MAG: hypothetical protein A3B38_02290 [Candidatus Levybacteria bacterium RIFCSPLOWO2_01_FULL_36_13]
MKPNFLTLILTGVVVFVVLVGAYLFLSKGSTYAPTIQETTISEIKNDEELSKANDALDTSDLDEVDSSLNQLDSDLSNF